MANDNDKDLLTRIKRLESDVLSYKTSQPVGTDSVRVFQNQTNNIWDVEQTVVESFAGAGYGQVRASVRFKADHQSAPFGRMRWFATVNGVNYSYTTSSENATSATPYIFSSIDNLTPTTEELNDPTLLRFNIVGSAAPGVVLRYKFIIDATDTGRIYWDLF